MSRPAVLAICLATFLAARERERSCGCSRSAPPSLAAGAARPGSNVAAATTCLPAPDVCDTLSLVEIGMQARLRPADDVVFRTVGDEVVILSIGSGLFFGLTPPGPRIWELIDQGKTLDEILAVLVAEYDAGEDAMKADLRQLVTELAHRGLVTSVPAART